MANPSFLVKTIGTLLILTSGSSCADEAASARMFTLKVLPILKSKCFACHGNDPNDLKGGFDIRSRESILKGGESGEPAIAPGQPTASPLLSSVKWEGLEMPPKENDRLTEAQIQTIEQWIAAGALWPDETTQKMIVKAEQATLENEDGIIVPTSGGLSEDWTYRRYQPAEVWAFQPLQKFSDHSFAQQGGSPVDYFIRKALSFAGIKPAETADALTLIRRATYDLIGLPPTPEQITIFQNEWNSDKDKAWSRLIDRLLDSPHYGERWGQHWLDVTRYSDTGGMANDYERSNMWRYRDYVIRSFNTDKPYNEFIVEQLAGDELADESVRRRYSGDEAKVRKAQTTGDYTAEEAELIVASGFLRLGSWDNAMVTVEEARQIYLDDLINNVGQTFLSTAMRCCKCHDHKFDPLPTRDYYRMYAAFAGTQMAERSVPFLPAESQEGFEEGRAHVERMLAFAVAEKNLLVTKRENAAKAWFAEHNLPYKDEAARKDLPDEQKPPRHVGLNYVEQGQLKVREQDEWIWTRRLERYEPMVQSVYNSPETKLAWNGARKLRIARSNAKNIELESYILTGGSLMAKGERVSPGVLSAIKLPVDSTADDPYVLPDAVEGRRLAFARWVADSGNPITARSFVNRVWQHHFGFGIARNPNNFGAKGGLPSHPELLDWLATDFMNNGWKLKRLHKLIMTSDTYRQSASHPQLNVIQQDDPNNELLAYFPLRRLTAEELRDSMLFITGEMNHAVGGLPVMPEINMEVALQPRMIQFSLAPAYQPSPTPTQRNRRTIYAYRVRGQADPFLELFNTPNPNESCEARDAAAVTPQAFTLLNSDVVTDRSIAFAMRLQKQKSTTEERVRHAFNLALGRSPSDAESDRMAQYVNDMKAYHSATPATASEYPTQITRSLVEEFTGEPFEYIEILPVFEKYQPDTKASDVSPETRALADMCLLLFNSNPFMYLQ